MDARSFVGTWKSYRMDYLQADKPSESNSKLTLVLRQDGTGEIKMKMVPTKLKFLWHVEEGEVIGISKKQNSVIGVQDIGNGEIKLMYTNSLSYTPNFAYYMRRA